MIRLSEALDWLDDLCLANQSFVVKCNNAEIVIPSLEEDCCQVVIVTDNPQEFARMVEEEDVMPMRSGNMKV